MKNLIYVAALFLVACQDDLGSLPDVNQKHPSREPDSFSFTEATQLVLGSRTFPTSIYSSAPAETRRFYQFTLGYFDLGTNLGDLKDVSVTSGNVSLEWYDSSQTLITSSASAIGFGATASSYIESGCFDCDVTFYLAVNNDGVAEESYHLQFSWYDN